MTDRPVLRQRAVHHSQMLMPTRCVDLPPSPAHLLRRACGTACVTLRPSHSIGPASGRTRSPAACTLSPGSAGGSGDCATGISAWRRHRRCVSGYRTARPSPHRHICDYAQPAGEGVAADMPRLIWADGGPAAGHRKCRRDGIAAVSGGYGFPEVSASAIGMRWRMPRLHWVSRHERGQQLHPAQRPRGG